jgi:hypothetical protein
MSEGPIPWTATEQYALSIGLSGYEKERFHTLVKNLDIKYLEFRETQRKRDK